VFEQEFLATLKTARGRKSCQLIARSIDMFAVFQSGGKQHRVAEGDVVRLEMLSAEPGEEIIFDKVLLVSNGEDVNVGTPYVETGRVTGEVMRTDRGKKIRIIKFKRRKDFLKKQGHRQWFTEVKITGISS
jgi:large subunit ribosomal protein L21